MKKMNNKGFAISSLLYGLTIMVFLIVFALMSIMGSTRKNTKNLVDVIDDELNRYGLTNVAMEYDSRIDTNDQGRKYVINSSGWYKIELLDSSYKDLDGNDVDGSYSSGIIYLDEDYATSLYVFLRPENSAYDNDTYVAIEEPDRDNTIIEAPRFSKIPESNAEDTNNFTFIGAAGSDSSASIKLETYEPKFYSPIIIPKVHSGASKFKITKISAGTETEIPIDKMTHKLDNVRYIRDCTTGSDASKYNAWQEIQAISGGKNVALGKNIDVTNDNDFNASRSHIVNGDLEPSTGNDEDGTKLLAGTKELDTEFCVTVDLESPYNLDELAVWHYSDGRKYHNHKIYVSTDELNWTNIRSTVYANLNGKIINTSEREDALGIRYSAYQPITADEVQDGNYYLLYFDDTELHFTDAKNKVLYPPYNFNVSSQKFSPGNKEHIWKISKNSDNTTSKITNVGKKQVLERNDNMNIYCTNDTATDNQKWLIYSYPDGFFAILDPTRLPEIWGASVDSGLIPEPYFEPISRFKLIRAY